MTTSFTSMDASTAEQWAVIGAETTANQGRVADRVLAMLESLADVVDGFAVDQLTHCLQTATRAERAGADDEVVVASLCHDIGKAVSVPNHPRIAAEILRPYVRAEVTEAILVPPGLPGPALLPPLRHGPEPARQLPGRALVRRWPSGSPTSGTRPASTPTTRPSPWPTSSPRSGPSSPPPTRSDGADPAPPVADPAGQPGRPARRPG